MRELTPEQRRAVECPGPVCLVASAGSGKTAVLVERYLGLLAQGLRPDQILTVTFTRKAGQQLRDRILERLAEGPAALREAIALTPWIGTLHSFCLQVIKAWGTLLGRESLGDVLDPLDRAQLVLETRTTWLDTLPVDVLEELFEIWTPQDLQAMAEEILARPHGFRAALATGAAGVEREALLGRAFSPLVEAWESRLAKERLCTFDDLEYDAVRLLRDFEAPRAHFQKLFRALLVDEFQDTSPSQWLILQALLGEDMSKLFVVGDPKQSIYRFRHADVSLFQKWGASIADHGGELLELRTCFRSSPKLVDTINGMASVLFQGSPLGDSTMLSGRAPSELPPLEVHRYGGDTAAHAGQEERTMTAKRVAELVQQGTPPAEIALLFRNGDRMESFAVALAERGVPVACEPNAPLFSLYEVQDLTAALRALAKPLDDYTLAAFLRTPYAGLLPADLVSLQTQRRPSLFEKLLHAGKLGWWVGLVESGEVRTERVLQALFEKSGYWPRRGGALYALLGGLSECRLLPDALVKLTAWEEQGVSVSAPLASHQADGVRLQTVHASKGLEFDEVFLVDTLRRPPTRLSWFAWGKNAELGVRYREDGEIKANAVYETILETQRKEEADEANRILYVALTRAKNRLHWMLPENAKLIPKGSWADSLKV